MFNRETQKNWMKSQVAHSLRGRLRLRVEGLNFLNDEKEEIAQMLANLPGVQCVQVTPITCGILLRFDPTATDTSILCEGVDVTMARYAMNAYRNSIQQIVAMREVCHQGEETLNLSLDLYKQGLTPFQNVLDALRSLLTYENQLVQAQGNSLIQLISLYQALGGGWSGR